MRNFLRGALFAGILLAAPAWGQETTLFPEPLEVEHRLVQTDPDGTFTGDPVKDTYIGNFLVSERPDGSRLVVDLLRREMTEIRPQEGSYWTIGFDRFADLRRRLALIAGPRAAAGLAPRTLESAPAERIAVEEIAGELASAPRLTAAGEAPEPPPGRRRFRVALAGGAEREAGAAAAEAPAGQWLEVEVDPRRQFSAAASEALARYEEDAFASAERGAGSLPFEKALAAVRARSGRALAVRTVRPLHAGGRRIGTLETEVLASRPAEGFDESKLRVPEGLERRPHPLETALLMLEQEQRIDDALAGKVSTGQSGSQP